MVYRANIPQSTDFISTSQINLINNFESVNDIYGKTPIENENVGDHVPLTTAQEDERGGHKKTTLIEQSSDSTTLVDELGLYSKDNSDITELYYREESDGTVNQVTDQGGIIVGGLVLRAYVLFDLNGNIIEVERLDEEDEKIQVPVSFNIRSIVLNTPPFQGVVNFTDYTINFTNSLPTADYMWILQSFNDNVFTQLTNPVVSAQPMNDGTYSNVVTANAFRAFGYNMFKTTVANQSPVIGRFDRIIFQAYTVA